MWLSFFDGWDVSTCDHLNRFALRATCDFRQNQILKWHGQNWHQNHMLAGQPRD